MCVGPGSASKCFKWKEQIKSFIQGIHTASKIVNEIIHTAYYKVSIWAIKKDDSSIIIFQGYIISYFIVIFLGGYWNAWNFYKHYYIFFQTEPNISKFWVLYTNSSAEVLNYMSYWYVLHLKSFVTRT